MLLYKTILAFPSSAVLNPAEADLVCFFKYLPDFFLKEPDQAKKKFKETDRKSNVFFASTKLWNLDVTGVILLYSNCFCVANYRQN
jgi:hypothetical protein